ncbi:hypothetical protein GALMADRAFT_142857 [Galerina marginata CBS 339.88]|uniref:Uncharacterized protein n=1 Tax=Galerina marginata (strain CBS 339.88) TaxID=685588 RepID=A0A067SNN0_GALM3|nr:hypothetical protein GALMADRAFT_142857 [Galerina marginata CBS 339.88]
MQLAERAIKPNPRQPYFWFALSLTKDHVWGLHAAKKVLKCGITPYVKYQGAMEQAGLLGNSSKCSQARNPIVNIH